MRHDKKEFDYQKLVVASIKARRANVNKWQQIGKAILPACYQDLVCNIKSKQSLEAVCRIASIHDDLIGQDLENNIKILLSYA